MSFKVRAKQKLKLKKIAKTRDEKAREGLLSVKHWPQERGPVFMAPALLQKREQHSIAGRQAGWPDTGEVSESYVLIDSQRERD